MSHRKLVGIIAIMFCGLSFSCRKSTRTATPCPFTLVGQPVAEYFRERIWEPIGADADATWSINTFVSGITFGP
jgi:hypothetical protein